MKKLSFWRRTLAILGVYQPLLPNVTRPAVRGVPRSGLRFRRPVVEQLEDRSLLATVGIGPSGLHVSEGGTATLQATLSQTQMQPVTVYYRTVAGTATENTDYTGVTNQSVTIPPNATFANISVSALNDSASEGPETFSVELLGASGATINPSASSTVVTIDNVQAGGGGGGGGTTTLTLSAPANVNEGDGFLVTAQLSTPGVYQINAMIDWGATPGAGPAGFNGTTNPDGSFTIGHQYFDDGPAPGNGTPQDVQSITLTGTATQYTMQGPVTIPLSGITSTTIHNVDPEEIFDVYNYMPLGGPWWKATGVFQDVGLTDRGTAVINWGDGSPDTVFTDLEVGDEFSPEAHRYPRHGLSYTVTITLTDDDTGSVSYSKGFTLYLFELDNDANNNGEINAIDEPYEPLTPGVTPPETSIPGPGRYIAVNNDDDNENGVADCLDSGPVAGEDDLEPIDVTWEKPSRPDINNYQGWRIILTVWQYSEEAFYQNPRIWLTPDKSGEPLVIRPSLSDEYVATWTVGGANPSIPGDRDADELPKRFYVEAGGLGLGMRLRLRTPGEGNGGQMVEEDYIAFAVVPADVEVDLIIHDGQRGDPIKDADEDKTGAVTVANLNDTDADSLASNNNSKKDFEDPDGVVETRTGNQRHGRNEVDLMLLKAKRPVGYIVGTFADLRIIPPDRIRLWNDEFKITPSPGYFAGAGLIALSWGAGDFAPKQFWVEIVSKSDTVADIQIDLSYGGKTDTVVATGVWATLTDEKYSDTNWAALGAPWATEMDKTLQDSVKEYGGTGVRNVGIVESEKIHYANVIVFQFTVFPNDVTDKLSRVQFDTSRQKQGHTYMTLANGTTVIVEPMSQLFNPTFPIQWERANDDSNDDDESAKPINGHFYGFDYPGLVGNHPPDAGEPMKLHQKGNFIEFMRVGFKGRPTGNTVAGSQCSGNYFWHSWSTIDRSTGQWQRFGGAAVNNIDMTHIVIGDQP